MSYREEAADTSQYKKYFFKTYGCQMNVYDSEKMEELLKKHLQMLPAATIDDADLLIMNTCSIREKAQEKVFSELGRWKKQTIKKQPVICVAGCVASQEAENIIKRAPIVDMVIGPQTIHKLPAMYLSHLSTGKAQIDVDFPEIEKFDHLPHKSEKDVVSYLTIMEGCNKYCSYCIVPYTRGTEISRSYESVIQEAQTLASSGTKEIVLLGQNVNDYMGSYENGDHEHRATLAVLIQSISQIKGIDRIRFTTSHPSAFDDSLIAAYADPTTKLCNHLHLPVQSGSDRILKLMKRDYKIAQYVEIIEMLKKVRPNIKISTDIIVGFPGETEEDFQATLNLAEKIGFDHSFSFIYSPRPGTPASDLVDEVPLAVKKERLARLQAVLRKSMDDISSGMLNRSHKVLVESRSKFGQGQLTGRTENNRIVNFIGSDRLIGHVVDVLLTKIHTNSISGRLQV